MFYNTSLKKVPALPVTKLAVGCYKQMFANSYGLGGSIVLPAEELPAECYEGMFSWCRKLEKVECRATSMTGNNALTNWLIGAGTELETNPVFVRAEANNKWKNKDGWAVSQTPNDWYIPTNWTIEPPITEYERTYTDGPFPFWSLGCTPPVINGAIHYEPNGGWNQFMCVDYGEFPLTAGNYVYVLDLQSDKDADGIVFNVLSGWGTGDQNITVSVPVKAGRKKYELDFSGILGDHEGKYYSILRPGTVDATLDLYSVTIKRVLE